MPPLYQLARDGRVLGTFTTDQLRAMLDQGTARSQDLAWCEGMTNWAPLYTVLGLVPATPPPPLPVTRPVGPPRRVWPWVVAGIALLALLIGGTTWLLVASLDYVKHTAENSPDVYAQKPLFEERKGHTTAWKKCDFKAAGPADKPPQGVLDLVHYESPAGKLAAYLTPDPKDGKKHPAIVWAHGGFGGVGSYFWDPASKRNDQSARAFREAGIVMMMPSWRGENDNPGRFEMFYGEVEDMLAAIDHVKTLPWVDPERVYIGGHSTGGTMTLLCAVASDKFRAAFSFGGMTDAVATIHQNASWQDTSPFEVKVRLESRLRSPVRYSRFITRPTFYFEGSDSYYNHQASEMMDRAERQKVPFTAFELPGDHFDVLHPTTKLVAQKILADTGKDCGITFTLEELRAAYNTAFSGSLAKTLRLWQREGGDLKDALDKADEEDVIPQSKVDIAAMVSVISRLTTQPHDPKAAPSIALLTGLMDDADDDDVWDLYAEQVLPACSAWLQARMKHQAPYSDEEAKSVLDLIETLVMEEYEGSANLVIEAASRAIAPGDYGWESLLGSYDDEHEDTARVMRDLSRKLPPDFIGVSLLAAANDAMNQGWKGPHPFDSPDGQARLRAWLENPDKDQFAHAHRAAVGLAHLSPERRADLLPLGLNHPEHSVRLEAAWADAMNKGTQGLSVLTTAALDVHQSAKARRYLKEAAMEQHVPAAALEPAFAATAAMSDWLQHRNELGGPPLSLDVFDSRELYWPPIKKKTPVWLFRFTYKFEAHATPKTGYGMVGGMTWSSFEEHQTPPTPEDLYVHHCALELSRNRGNRRDQVKQVTADEARTLLAKENPGMFQK